MLRSMLERFHRRSTPSSPASTSEIPRKITEKPKFRFANLTPKSSRTFQGLTFLSKSKKSGSSELPLVSNLFPPESARSVEIVKPRRKATIESSRKPSLYDEPTLTEPSRGCSIAEPESPLEGRRTKMGATSKAPDKHPDTVTALGIISMTDNTVPEAAEDLSVDVVAVRAIQSPATSSGSSSYFTAAMVLEYSLQEWTQSQNSSTSGIVREEAASMVPIHTPDSTRQNLLRIATVLQRAARQARDQEALSQASTFRAVSPLLLFVLVLVIGTLLPQQYSTLQERYGTQCGAMVSFLVIGGAGCALLLLRAMIWVAGVLGESFCQMDLNSALRQGECRDVDGTQMREADLLICSFLFG